MDRYPPSGEPEIDDNDLEEPNGDEEPDIGDIEPENGDEEPEEKPRRIVARPEPDDAQKGFNPWLVLGVIILTIVTVTAAIVIWVGKFWRGHTRAKVIEAVQDADEEYKKMKIEIQRLKGLYANGQTDEGEAGFTKLDFAGIQSRALEAAAKITDDGQRSEKEGEIKTRWPLEIVGYAEDDFLAAERKAGDAKGACRRSYTIAVKYYEKAIGFAEIAIAQVELALPLLPSDVDKFKYDGKTAKWGKEIEIWRREHDEAAKEAAKEFDPSLFTTEYAQCNAAFDKYKAALTAYSIAKNLPAEKQEKAYTDVEALYEESIKLLGDVVPVMEKKFEEYPDKVLGEKTGDVKRLLGRAERDLVQIRKKLAGGNGDTKKEDEFTPAQEIYVKAEDKRKEAFAAYNRGRAAYAAGEKSTATEKFEEAIKLYLEAKEIFLEYRNELDNLTDSKLATKRETYIGVAEKKLKTVNDQLEEIEAKLSAEDE